MVCARLEFVIDVEGRERTAGLFWVQTSSCSVNWKPLRLRPEEMQRKWGRPVLSALSLLTLSVTRFTCLGRDFLRNRCFSQGSPDEKSPGELASSPVKHGEEKPVQREPQKTLGQTRQRHRDEKCGPSTRHGRGRVRQGLWIFRLKYLVLSTL